MYAIRESPVNSRTLWRSGAILPPCQYYHVEQKLEGLLFSHLYSPRPIVQFSSRYYRVCCNQRPKRKFFPSLRHPFGVLLTHSFLTAKQLFFGFFTFFYAIFKCLKPEHDCYAKFTSCST